MIELMLANRRIARSKSTQGNYEMNDQVLQEKQVGNGLLITGYVFAFLGGFFGIIIGMLIWRGKHLVDEEKEFVYERNSRRHGKIMFWMSLVLLIFYTILNAGMS